MAKRKAKPKRRVEADGAVVTDESNLQRIESNGVITDDFGVYIERSFDASDQKLLKQNILALRNAATMAPRPTAIQQLHVLRQRMRITVSSAVIPEGGGLAGRRWAIITADLGDGLKTHVCYAEREAGIEGAASVLNAIDWLLSGDIPTDRDLEVFLAGIAAGQCLEAITNLLPHERPVLKEKRRIEAGQVKKQTKKTRARDRFAILRADDPHSDKGPLVERICSELDITRRTADGYLSGLK